MLRNEAGDLIFVANDVDAEWRGRKRPAGRYVSTGWIPGNLLQEGAISVGTAFLSLEPWAIHGSADEAIHFRVVFPLGAKDTARGISPVQSPGIVQPILRWSTRYEPRAEPVETKPSECGAI